MKILYEDLKNNRKAKIPSGYQLSCVLCCVITIIIFFKI